SQLRISFFAPGDKLIEWNNKHESIDYEQFSFQDLDQGLRVNYTLGQEWELEDYIPGMASKEFFEEEILAKLDESDRKFVLDKFWFCKLVKNDENPDDYTFTDISARIDEKDLFKDYVIKMKLGNGKEVELTAHGKENGFPSFMKENALKYLLGKIVEGKGYMFITDLKHEDLMVFKNPFYIQIENMFKWDRTKLAKLFKGINLDPAGIAEEHKKYNIEIPYKNIRVFKIPLEYRLDGRDLLVQVPLDEVEYPNNVMDYAAKYRVTMPLIDIDVLPYFSAGSIKDEGYIFVPDGSGALINFNNGKVDLPKYHKLVYGKDKALAEIKRKATISAPVRLPVFGIKKNNQGFLGIIEDGDNMAEIRAKVANNINSYNTVYSQFGIIPYTNMQLVGATEKGSNINLYQSRKNSSRIAIRYKLLTGEETGYSGMARNYRRYLKEKYKWEKLAGDDIFPMLVEIIGGYHKILPWMGIPRRTVIPLTTFSEAKNLIEELQEVGIKNPDILYNGWLSGGIKHIYPEKVAIEKKLGGKKDFEEFSEYLQENQIDLYPEVDFLYVHNDRIFDGFNWFNHSSRYLEGGQAKVYDYNQATYRWQPDESSYLLSPRFLEGLIDKFMSDYKEMDISGLSLRHLGSEYYSDFRKDPDILVDREQAVSIIEQEINNINKVVPDLMVRGGNFPALSRSRYIVEAPMYGGADNLIDRGIPFYQMVLHGYVKYTGKPINLAASSKRELLKIIETGAIPYYRGSYQRSDLLKQSNFNENYSLYYQDWIEQAGDFYEEAAEVLVDLQDKEIINHKQISKNAYQTEYENGVSIVVNYGEGPVEVNNTLIQGNSYQVFRGEG
ncbi:MAG: DUF5696 domain-containing protein, partial [Halanaerobiales bacterium]